MKKIKEVLFCILLATVIALLLTFEVICIDFYLNENTYTETDNPQIYWTVELSDTNDKVENK